MHKTQAADVGSVSHLRAIEGGRELDRLITHCQENNKFLEQAVDELDHLANRLGMFAPPEAGARPAESPDPSGAIPVLFAEVGRATEIGVRLRAVIERLQRL